MSLARVSGPCMIVDASLQGSGPGVPEVKLQQCQYHGEQDMSHQLVGRERLEVKLSSRTGPIRGFFLRAYSKK